MFQKNQIKIDNYKKIIEISKKYFKLINILI